MGILARYLLRNIAEKKMRSFLIVSAVSVATALFFPTSALSTTMESLYQDALFKYAGTADIVISSSQDSPSQFIDPDLLAPWQQQLDYSVAVVAGYGWYEGQDNASWIELVGINWPELEQWNQAVVDQEHQLLPFSGNKIVLSTPAARARGLEPGDVFELEVNGQQHTFELAATALPRGIFMEDGQSTYAIVPREILAALNQQPGAASAIYAKAAAGIDAEQLLADLEQALPCYDVSQPHLPDQLDEWLALITRPFILITAIVFLLSSYIIFTTFNLIVVQRLPVMGTFRSIGATRKHTNIILLAEGMVYGLLGGVLGSILGLGVLAVMSSAITGEGVESVVVYSAPQVFTTIGAAVLLTLLSALLPVLAVNRIAIKDIILNVFAQGKAKPQWQPWAGTATLALALLLPRAAPGNLLFPFASAALLLALLAVFWLTPSVVSLLAKMLSTLHSVASNGSGIMAAMNLRDNTSTLNSITLLALALGLLLTVNTTSFSVARAVAAVYADTITFDVVVQVPQGDADTVAEVTELDGVESVLPVYSAWGVGVAGHDTRINCIEGADPQLISRYYNLDISPEALGKLGHGRTVILSHFLCQQLGVATGDTLTLETETGNYPYTVAGTADSLLYNGSFALMSADNLRRDMNLSHYSKLLVSVSTAPDDVAAAIRDQLRPRRPEVATAATLERLDAEANATMFNLLRGFSVLSLAIGATGIVNNLLINFIQRRRLLALLHSVGMSKRQVIGMVLWEALGSGLAGGLIGTLTGIVLLVNMPWVIQSFGIPLAMELSVPLLLQSFAAGMLIMIIASVAPALRSSRLDIVTELKYE